MNQERWIDNITDQIKEAQIKLGYVKETVRLYYPGASVGALLGIEASGEKEVLEVLQGEESFQHTKLGALSFAVRGGRIEVSVPPEGVEYVYREVPEPEFLKSMIRLFEENHHCTKQEICALFGTYNSSYVCEDMPEGMDFDYVLYFPDGKPDAYCYCIKEEMGHTIYHRFAREDYLRLL